MIRLATDITLKKNLSWYKNLIQLLKFNNSSKLIDELMLLGFEYITNIPVSLNFNDLKLKKHIIKFNINSINLNKSLLIKLIFIFSKNLELLKYTTPLTNSLLLYEKTGARSTWEQIKQLLTSKGYILNSNNVVLYPPILTGYKSGLDIYEFMLSCYGARKGVLDSSIKTSESGYLTRRLIETLHEFNIKEYTCSSTSGENIIFNSDILGHKDYFIHKILSGKLLLTDLYNKETGELILKKNTVLTSKSLQLLQLINSSYKLEFTIKTMHTCLASRSICQSCLGNYICTSKYYINTNPLNIGILGAQSIGEPATQLTLRTFHTGGVFNTLYWNKLYNTNNVDLKLDNLKMFSIPTLTALNSNTNLLNIKQLFIQNTTYSEPFFPYQIFNLLNIKQFQPSIRFKLNNYKYIFNNIYTNNLIMESHTKEWIWLIFNYRNLKMNTKIVYNTLETSYGLLIKTHSIISNKLLFIRYHNFIQKIFRPFFNILISYVYKKKYLKYIFSKHLHYLF